jgi:hypothetical protein
VFEIIMQLAMLVILLRVIATILLFRKEQILQDVRIVIFRLVEPFLVL